jgi:23S rRNA (guanine2445-N2)-methyltransferase
MYIYQKTGRYFAQTAGGMEEAGADELKRLGAEQVEKRFRGAIFRADRAALYRINYTSRLITRVIAPLLTFRCYTPDDIYRAGMETDWSDFFDSSNTFAVFANVSNSRIKHSRYAALRLKDAVADAFRKSRGTRPSVDTRNPDIWINLHVENNRATIGMDTSGGSLHRRGYRRMSVEAPMQEILAAAIIHFSGWDGTRPIHDPMCGSGTLLCEALMSYCNVPSGLLRRRFGFEFLPDFSSKIWREEKARAGALMRELPNRTIYGNDISGDAVASARKNLLGLPGGRGVNLKTGDYKGLSGLENSVIVCNPPYGVRMKQENDLDLFYRDLGDFLKHQCTGASAYIYFGNLEMIKRIGLKPSWKKPLKNGGLDGRLVKYEMY